MLGRLHMLNGDMAAAETALNRVTGYSLVDCFHDMFSTAGETGPEMIFSIQASVNDGSGGSDNGNFGDRLNFPHAGSPFGCCGFHQPTQNLVNAYRVDGTGLPLNDNSSDDNPTASESVDPRLDWTVGRDGVPYLDWGVHDASWIRSRSWAGQYSPRKFAHLSSEASNVGWNSNHLSPVNVPIIRYADVLLMLAEIDVDNGRLDAAQDKVNMIRMRAANCAQGDGATPVPLDDPSTAHATYSVSPYPAGAFASMGAADAMEAVRLERRLELALEGHRWFDLRRYGTDYAINTMTTYFEREDPRRPFISQREPVEAKHMVYPIPTAAILQSTVDGAATLRQNPGY
ncbi:MAG: RagB/SusD family nutrient uptake outer membrane protein [Bacteroidota bacterium]